VTLRLKDRWPDADNEALLPLEEVVDHIRQRLRPVPRDIAAGAIDQHVIAALDALLNRAGASSAARRLRVNQGLAGARLLIAYT
jgi:hypothetical protein